ncbi:MAG: phosphatidylglycerophosphatase A [Acidimicrobiia bacterium]
MKRLVASWFGTGFIPRRLFGTDSGAGTVGALFALIPALLLGTVGWAAQLAGVFAVAVGSLWSAAPFTRSGEDPNWIVVDEAAGGMLSVVGLTSGWWWIPAFLAFRLFDGTKWAPGVAAAERLRGSIGVTADDLVAGAWALLLGWALRLVFP